MSLEATYGDWRLYNELVIEALARMSAEELALRAPVPAGDQTSSTDWPIWAILGHTPATRVYWLCAVLGVPGADSTPFGDPDAPGWEDDPDHPRSAEELAGAWTSTWSIVERALGMWTLPMLDEPMAVPPGGGGPHLTRRSLLLRLIVHEGYHLGEIATIQAIHGRAPIDLWPPGYHTVEATAARGQRAGRSMDGDAP